MDISVIVPTLNEEKYLERCLRSIANQTYPREKYEIIVSDGESSDKTVEIAKKYADKVVVSKKKGIWWGRNYGAKFAKGKYLVFVDADTQIPNGYFKTVIRYLSEGYLAMSAGYRLDEKGLKTKITETLANWYWALGTRFRKTYLLGHNLCVSKEAFWSVGGFKPGVTEDEHLSIELSKRGRLLFLNKKLVLTSNRRFQKCGFIGTCAYYLKLTMEGSQPYRSLGLCRRKKSSYRAVR